MTRVGVLTAATRAQKRGSGMRKPNDLDDRDVSAHRVAHQHHRFADHAIDEVVDERDVGADRGGASEEWRLAESREVDGQRAARLRDRWTHSHPVERVSAETVDHEHRPARAAEVDVMHWSADIRDSMPHCVKRSYARIPAAKRISTSATADAGRRPPLWSRSNMANELSAAMTSSASRNEHPGRSVSDAASRSARPRTSSGWVGSWTAGR